MEIMWPLTIFCILAGVRLTNLPKKIPEDGGEQLILFNVNSETLVTDVEFQKISSENA